MKFLAISFLFLNSCIVGEYTFKDKNLDYEQANVNKQRYICHVVMENEFANLELAKDAIEPAKYNSEILRIQDYIRLCDEEPQIYRFFK